MIQTDIGTIRFNFSEERSDIVQYLTVSTYNDHTEIKFTVDRIWS